MLNRIIAFSLKNRILVIFASLFIAVYGTFIAFTMPVDVLPDLNRPTVTVVTEVHSLVPEDVERLITIPLEQVFNGATGVERVRSSSGLGISIIIVEFEWDTDIYRNRQIVQEKIQLAKSKLPKEANPQMAPISSIMGQIQLVGIQSKTIKTTELRALVDYKIKYRLLAIPGISQIISIGGAPRQLQVIVNSDRMRAFDVTLAEVAKAVEKANINSAGGFINIGAKGPSITVTGRIIDKKQLQKAVVRFDKIRPITINDVAMVEFGPAAIRVGDAGINAYEGVIMGIFKQPGTDTVAVTEKINKELLSLQKGLSKDITIVPDIFQQSIFIERAIHNVVEAVRDGGALVFLVLFLFLMSIRTTFITLTAIPLSVAITTIIFDLFGLSINTMTLGGLAVAIGALVDDAIVDVENVYRRLRENAVLTQPKHPLWVIFRASSEVRKPILFGTLLVIVVYLPLFFLAGLEGRLFVPIGIAYILSVASSLIVALTITPILCYYLLSTKNEKAKGDTWVVRKLKNLTGTVISFSIRNHSSVLAVFLVTVLVGLFLLINSGSQFLPPFNEGVAQVNMYLPPEVALKTSNDFGKRLEKILVSVPGVHNIGRRTGRSENDEIAHGVNITEIFVTFDPKANLSRNEVVADIRQKLKKEFPGIPSEVDQPLSHMLSHMLSGVKAQVAIKTYGQDLETLRSIAKKIESAIKPIPGVVDLYVEQQVLVDHIVIEPRREQLTKLGVSVEEIAEFVELAMEGEEVSRMQIGSFTYPIIVRLKYQKRQNLDDIRKLKVRTENGALLRLSDLANVYLGKTPNNINRENVSRLIVVQHNVAGRSLGEVIADIQQALKPLREELAKTTGYSIRIGGQYAAQISATKRIFILSFVSLIIMFLVLYAHFKSASFAVLVLTSIPMAFVGAMLYIVLSNQDISVATMVGLISLGGIAARNSILLLDRYVHLMRDDKMAFSPQMIIQAGKERMVPVIMTALTSGIALVPIALAPGEPGREILYPVATVIIGGLISATILDFIVVPALFWMFGKPAAEKMAIVPEVYDAATEEMSLAFQNPQQ
ncbi:efflux RND transporter permease subunit [Candidatus Uabimicrobium sp. HlEnr_7]|uniref:efflux RND transporter permease subunit n=1 Tax=Candidatus Uabimicrobium helgolandensis TaxID=3095367 RepID=UPI003558D9A1